MEAVTASRFISKGSQVKYGGAFDSEPRKFQSKSIPSLKRQASAYHGLGSQNIVDQIQMQVSLKAKPRPISRSRNHKVCKPCVIICGCGISTIFVGVEVAPWSKTGGLGDVLGGLPPALAANGHRVMTVSPRYDQYKDAWDTSVLVQIEVGNRILTARFFHCYKRGVDRVFVDHPIFLEKVWGKTGGKIYGPVTGTDYEDNQLGFSLLCLILLHQSLRVGKSSSSSSQCLCRGPRSSDSNV